MHNKKHLQKIHARIFKKILMQTREEYQFVGIYVLDLCDHVNYEGYRRISIYNVGVQHEHTSFYWI